MATNQNHDNDDASSTMKRFKTCDNGGVVPWSDLHHHLLYLVMMKLEVVDYFSFAGVCKSWRSFALSEKNMFMSSKPPMLMRIAWGTHAKTCRIKNNEGRTFKTTLDSFPGGTYIGLTCGYLIFFKWKTLDFWLVNPVTRHQLYFKKFPLKSYRDSTYATRAILVFSHSVRGWIFVVMRKGSTKIWFSIAGTGEWNRVYCRHNKFFDFHAFKGIIYTLNFNESKDLCELYELRLNPMPKLTLLEIKNSLKPSSTLNCGLRLVRLGDNICVKDHTFSFSDRYRYQELNFDEMKWVLHEGTMTQYESFLSNSKLGVADELVFSESDGKSFLLDHDTRDMVKLMKVKILSRCEAFCWYLPYECLNVDLID